MIFQLNSIWTEEQESMINSFFEALVAGEMFALDWQHDCFSFSPKEHIPYEFEYYDDERNWNGSMDYWDILGEKRLLL